MNLIKVSSVSRAYSSPLFIAFLILSAANSNLSRGFDIRYDVQNPIDVFEDKIGFLTRASSSLWAIRREHDEKIVLIVSDKSEKVEHP